MLVADVIADIFTELAFLELRHSCGKAAAGDPSRLDHEHPSRAPTGYLSRFSGAGGCRHYYRTPFEGIEKRKAKRFYGKAFIAGGRNVL